MHYDYGGMGKAIQKPPFLVETRGFRGWSEKPLAYGQIEFSASGDGRRLFVAVSVKQTPRYPQRSIVPCPQQRIKVNFTSNCMPRMFVLFMVWTPADVRIVMDG